MISDAELKKELQDRLEIINTVAHLRINDWFRFINDEVAWIFFLEYDANWFKPPNGEIYLQKIKILCEFLLEHQNINVLYVHHLYLQHQYFDYTNFFNIAQVSKAYKSVTSIDLSYHNKNLDETFENLKISKSITSVFLSYNSKHFEEILKIARALNINKSITNMCFFKNINLDPEDDIYLPSLTQCSKALEENRNFFQQAVARLNAKKILDEDALFTLKAHLSDNNAQDSYNEQDFKNYANTLQNFLSKFNFQDISLKNVLTSMLYQVVEYLEFNDFVSFNNALLVINLQAPREHPKHLLGIYDGSNICYLVADVLKKTFQGMIVNFAYELTTYLLPEITFTGDGADYEVHDEL